MHARHPGIASRWDEEIRESKRKKRVRKSLSEMSKSVGGWQNVTPGPGGVGESQRDRQRRNLRAQASSAGKTQKQIRVERAQHRTAQAAGKVTPRQRKIISLTGSRKPSPLFRLSGIKVPGGRGTAAAVLVGGAGGGGYLVTKTDRKRDARDAAIGAGGAYGAYRGGSYTANMLTRNAARKDPVSNKLMGLHRKEHGLPTGPLADVTRHGTPAQKKAVEDYYRTIPHGVKYSGTRRLLARSYGPKGGGRLAAPVLAAGGAGAAVYGNRKRAVKKAYKPSYFTGSAPTERLQGENQRVRTELQHQAARSTALGLGGLSSAAVATRWLGHDKAPGAVRVAGKVARRKGVPKETVKDLTERADRLHTWAKPRRNKLLVGAVGAGAAATGARAVARWKKDETTGISQDLGRATAGDRGQVHNRRVVKSAGTALGVELGMKGAKQWGVMTPAQRDKAIKVGIAGVSSGAGAAGTGWLLSRKQRVRRENKQLRAAGGITGPVMKSEPLGFGKSNVREFPYLPENIREQAGYGSIGPRRNPMSPLDLFASSRIMAQTQARALGETVRGRRLTRRAHNEMNFAGSRAMLYSPAGRGSIF